MRKRLASAFAKREDPYAGVDLANASRFGGGIWLFGALLTAVLLPFVHPTVHGSWGWAALGVVIGVAVACGLRMRSVGANADVDELLVYSYVALACIAVVVWLTGGLGSAYAQLYVLSAVYTASVHPPRRVGAYSAVLAVLVLSPLVYDDQLTRRAVIELVTELVVWLTLALIVAFLMVYVRAQRLGLRREGEVARRQARLDPLTGLLNRRAFDEDLHHAIRRAKAGGAPLSVLVADLDDFKDFNDRYGHLEGDAVLKAVAESLRAAVRRPDVAYRWGGDEFAVILPQADLRGAELVADRVRAAVRRNAGPGGDALGIATGVADLERGGGGGPAALVDAADRALLRAKGSGVFEVPHSRR